jgi:hypothetical protein
MNTIETKEQQELALHNLAKYHYGEHRGTVDKEEGFIQGFKVAHKLGYTEDDLRAAIAMARGIKDGEETFAVEDISGLTEICTYDWVVQYTDDEIIGALKKQ